MAGSFDWMAPETVTNEYPVTTKADIFSMVLLLLPVIPSSQWQSLAVSGSLWL